MNQTVLKTIIHIIIAIVFIVVGPPVKLSLLTIILYYLAMCINAWLLGFNIANSIMESL